MILNHRYKFIFLKTIKTAGSSIEIALSKFCGKDDIVTPLVFPPDESLRTRLGFQGPCNYLAPVRDYSPRDVGALIAYKKRKRRFYNHISALEARRYIGANIWNSYYKFCVERNPWDRFLSCYYWLYRSTPRPSITELLDNQVRLNDFVWGRKGLKTRGLGIYMIDGQVAVDRVCLYEKLTEELEEVRDRLQIPEVLNLPRAKSTFRTESYRETLDEYQRARIEELFQEEICLFGYEF